MSKSTQCKIDSCDRRPKARGLCGKHYCKWQRTGDSSGTFDGEDLKRCTVDGCTKKHYGNGYCVNHNRRWKKYGDPLFVPDVTKPRLAPEPPLPETCTEQGCTRKHYARGRCRGCYNKILFSEIREPIHCIYCNEMFMPKSSVRKHCYRVPCERRRARDAVYKARDKWKDSGRTRWQREKASAKRYAKTCLICGEGYRTAKQYQKYCSHQCSNIARTDKPRFHRGEMMIYSPPAEDQARTLPTRTLIGSICKVCGIHFVAFSVDSFCSSECRLDYVAIQRRTTRDKYAALKRGASDASGVDRLKVFEADGYRCHLCGVKTDPKATFPHPRYPTIDHIVPVSLGGEHVQSNCATACNECNVRKSATGVGDQLRLFSYV